MIRLAWLERSHYWLKYGAAICGLLVVISGAALKISPDDVKSVAIVSSLVKMNLAITWWSVPSLTLVGGMLTFLKTHFGSKHTWRAVTLLLEEYRKSVFNGLDLDDEADYHHRVTLFKYTRFRLALCKWPWQEWLVPVARTGFTTHKRTIPRFRVPTKRPDDGEGVAGIAFLTRSEVHVKELPKVGETASASIRRKYAKQGFVSERWVNGRKTCNIRCLHGIPLEVKGKMWGTIVVDSRQRNSIPNIKMSNEPEFKRLNKLLSKMLEN